MSETKRKVFLPSEVKIKKPELKYVPLSWAHSSMQGCCGVLLPNCFVEQQYVTDWSGRAMKRNQVPPKFATREEQAQDAITRWEEEAKEGLYYVMTLSLVWKYRSGVEGQDNGAVQLPALHEALLKNGYNIDREWVAPRHGNTIRIYSKELPGAEQAYFDQINEDEDDD